jgi:Firmicute plasmid replication protein (RepL)
MNERKHRKPFLKVIKTVNVFALTEEGERYTAEKRMQIVEEDDKTFRMTFSEFVVFLNSSDSLVDVKVFNWILEHLGYNEEQITLTRPNKVKITEYTGFSYSAVEKSISSLTKKEILVKDIKYPRGGTYHVNPSYVWYGDREVRKGRLKCVLEILQHNNLPDKEKQTEEDIKRYDEWYHTTNKGKEREKQPKGKRGKIN